MVHRRLEHGKFGDLAVLARAPNLGGRILTGFQNPAAVPTSELFILCSKFKLQFPNNYTFQTIQIQSKEFPYFGNPGAVPTSELFILWSKFIPPLPAIMHFKSFKFMKKLYFGNFGAVRSLPQIQTAVNSNLEYFS